MDYPIALDTEERNSVNTDDVNVSLTYAEHDILFEILVRASEAFDFTTNGNFYDFPIDDEFVQRHTLIENLRERFSALWQDRFDT